MGYPRFLAIGGCPRSGTTALADLLNLDKRIFVTRELRLFRCWDRKIGKKTLSYKLKKSNLSSRIFYYHGLNCEQFRGTFSTGKQIAKYVINNTNIEYFGDKLPRWYLCNVAYLAEKFPTMKFIICLRDGRAVVASQIRLSKNKPIRKVTKYDPIKIIDSPFIANSIPVAQRLWIMTCEVLDKVVEGKYSDRVLVVKYEDAVKNVEKLARQLSNFLGLSPILNVEGNRYKPVHLESWKEELPNIMFRVNKRFKYYLEKHGYI